MCCVAPLRSAHATSTDTCLGAGARRGLDGAVEPVARVGRIAGVGIDQQCCALAISAYERAPAAAATTANARSDSSSSCAEADRLRTLAREVASQAQVALQLRRRQACRATARGRRPALRAAWRRAACRDRESAARSWHQKSFQLPLTRAKLPVRAAGARAPRRRGRSRRRRRPGSRLRRQPRRARSAPGRRCRSSRARRRRRRRGAATAPLQPERAVGDETIGRSGEPSAGGPSSSRSPSTHTSDGSGSATAASDRGACSRRCRRCGATRGCARPGRLVHAEAAGEEAVGASSAASAVSCGGERAGERRAGRAARCGRGSRRSRRRHGARGRPTRRRRCARRARAPPASTSPRAVSAAAGAARSAGSRPSATCDARAGVGRRRRSDGAGAAAAACSRWRRRARCPAAAPAANADAERRRRVAAGRRGERGWPLAGQLQRQPHASRTQAACSGATCRHRARSSARSAGRRVVQELARRGTSVAAGSALGRQSAPIGAGVVERASAHSSPASAASNAWVERYWLADARCSTTQVAVGERDDEQHREHSSIVTTSAAAPRWRGAASMRCDERRRDGRSHGSLEVRSSSAPTTSRCAARTLLRTVRTTAASATRAAADRDREAAHLQARRAGRAAGGAGLRRRASPRLDLLRRAASTSNAVTTQRRRIGERLPVAVAELHLDRAVAQAKAELLVAVDRCRSRPRRARS